MYRINPQLDLIRIRARSRSKTIAAQHVTPNSNTIWRVGESEIQNDRSPRGKLWGIELRGKLGTLIGKDLPSKESGKRQP